VKLWKVTSKGKVVFVLVSRAISCCKQIPKVMSCLPPPRVCVRLYAYMTRPRTSTHKMKTPGLLAQHNCVNIWRNIAYLLALWGGGGSGANKLKNATWPWLHYKHIKFTKYLTTNRIFVSWKLNFTCSSVSQRNLVSHSRGTIQLGRGVPEKWCWEIQLDRRSKQQEARETWTRACYITCILFVKAVEICEILIAVWW